MSQLDDVVALVQQVLGEALRGVAQHGSAVLGGGLHPFSDLDVLVVTGRRLRVGERRLLVDGLLRRSAPPGEPNLRPVELTAVVEAELRPWRYPPSCEFQFGEWLRAELEAGALPQRAPDPDLAPVLAMVHAADAPLLGPPPGELLPPVPWSDVRRAVVAGVPELREGLAADTRNVVLTLARILATLRTDALLPKDVAAAWTLERLPAEHQAVLRHARAVYLGEEREAWGERRAAVAAYVAYLLGVIEEAAAETRG